MKSKIKPTRKELEIMYLEDYMGAAEIGKKIGVSKTLIIKWLKEYKISIRNISEAKLKGSVKPSIEELERMYFDEGMNANEIGKTVGVSGRIVGIWLKNYGIQTRTLSESKLQGKFKPSKEELERMYLKEWLSSSKISKIVGVSDTTVLRWLNEYEIPVKNISEAMLKGAVKPTKKELERLYLDEWMNAYKIGEIIGVSNVTILAWLKDFGIPMRNNSEIHFKNRAVKPSEEELTKMYLEDKMSTYEIAKQIGIADVTVGTWLREFNIPTRTTSESMLIKDLTGEKCVHWKGGLSYLPYCEKFNTKLKDKIRERDNYICQNCGVEENGKKHNIHHIHYDKENCYPDLITVCHSCNAKANHKRDEWEIFFMDNLKERGLLNWTLNNGT